MIRREEKRLREIFQRLLLLSLAAPAAVQACSSSASTNEPGVDAGLDSTTPASDAEATEAGGEGGNGGMLDAGNCQSGQPYFTDASYAQLADSAADSPYYPCYYFVDLPCGTSNLTTGTGTTACYLYLNECAKICNLDGGGFVDCLFWQGQGCLDGSLTAEAGAPATIACGMCNGVGRRPAGLRGAKVARTRDPLGEYFAQVAHLEAASVFAFERLRDELRAAGAPSTLVRRAERSIRDEIRHARMTSRLARRHGGEPTPPRVRRSRLRGLERVAVENAVEGCVRETFGAMVATWQAAHAEDAEVRACMLKVAEDETRHAALAWAIAKWANTKLDARSRARVAHARRAAARRLTRDVSVALPPAASRAAGLPSDAEARALVAAMAEMWLA